VSNKSPAFQWYPKDILASARVQEMSLAEEGAYRRLLDYCWINGDIPADEKRCARLIGKGATVEIAKVCLEMFTASPDDDSRMIHDRLETEREKQEANSKARQKASEARWSKQGTSARGSGKQVNTGRKSDGKQSLSKCNANAMQMQSIASSTSSSVTNLSNGSGGNNARGKPPPAAADSAIDSKAKTEKRLDEFQEKYPHLQVREVFDKYIADCKANGHKPKWQIFEKHRLQTEFEPIEVTETVSKPAWQQAIDDCDLCNERGLNDTGAEVVRCKHGGN